MAKYVPHERRILGALLDSIFSRDLSTPAGRAHAREQLAGGTTALAAIGALR